MRNMHQPGNVRRARYRTEWSGFPGVVLVALAAVGLFEGCADPWKAPVESRSEARYRGAGIDGPVYRVKPGDTLYGIAWRAGVDYRDLASWNSVSAPYTIYVGQQLSVKGPARAASRKPAPPSASPKTSTERRPKPLRQPRRPVRLPLQDHRGPSQLPAGTRATLPGEEH